MPTEIIPFVTRQITCNLTKDQIKKSIEEIPKNLKTVELKKSVPEMNFYQLSTKADGLNLGALLQISIHEKGDNITSIEFHCSRNVGFINQFWEFEHCNNVITDCIGLIYKYSIS